MKIVFGVGFVCACVTQQYIFSESLEVKIVNDEKVAMKINFF